MGHRPQKLHAMRVRCVGPTDETSCTMNKTRKHSIPCPNCDGYALDPAYEKKPPKQDGPRIIGWTKKGMIKVPIYDD